jgi:hypothetical protein
MSQNLGELVILSHPFVSTTHCPSLSKQTTKKVGSVLLCYFIAKHQLVGSEQISPPSLAQILHMEEGLREVNSL